jgi:hypothetical protein
MGRHCPRGPDGYITYVKPLAYIRSAARKVLKIPDGIYPVDIQFA